MILILINHFFKKKLNPSIYNYTKTIHMMATNLTTACPSRFWSSDAPLPLLAPLPPPTPYRHKQLIFSFFN